MAPLELSTRLPRARFLRQRHLRAQADFLASQAHALAMQAHRFEATLRSGPLRSRPRNQRPVARRRRSRRGRKTELGQSMDAKADVRAETAPAACPALYPPGSMEWLSADEFLSVAFCAGFDSTDISWMDAFEAICWEHGCDPAVGVSKKAFLKLVNEGFEKRRQSIDAPTSFLEASQQPLVESDWPKPTTERLVAQRGWPKAAACSTLESEEEYLAEFQELAIELGPATVAQLGLDEAGYLWARHVFEQLDSLFLERLGPRAELVLPGLDLTLPRSRRTGRSAFHFGPLQSPLCPVVRSRGECQPYVSSSRLALPPPAHHTTGDASADSDDESGELACHAHVATSSSLDCADRCYANACWQQPAAASLASSSDDLLEAHEADASPVNELQGDGWNLGLYSMHWDDGDASEAPASQTQPVDNSSCLD